MGGSSEVLATPRDLKSVGYRPWELLALTGDKTSVLWVDQYHIILFGLPENGADGQEPAGAENK